MISSAIRFFLILACSFMQVRVHAAEVHSRAVEVIEEPQHCLKQNIECAVHVKAHNFMFKMNQVEVRAANGSSVIKKTPHLLVVARGEVAVKAYEDSCEIETLFGKINVAKGSVLLEVTDNQVRVTNIGAEVTYQPRGESKTLELPKGLMNEMGRVNSQGQAKTSYPRSMSLGPLIKVWSGLFKKSEFSILKDEFEAFVPHWRAGLEFVGPWYLETVTREIAEFKAEQERLRKLKAIREKEEGYYREMFRRKNFLD